MENTIIDLQLVIKLRDTFFFNKEVLDKFFNIKDTKTYLEENLKLVALQEHQLPSKIDSFHPIIDVFKTVKDLGHETTYLFDEHHDYDIFNQLQQWYFDNTQERVSNLTELPFPNFYNYFVINISKNNFEDDEKKMFETVLMELMLNFNKFVRDESIILENQVLDYFYLKGISEETSNAASITYFEQMNLPSRINLRTSDVNLQEGNNVKIYDIESDWDETNVEILDSNPATVTLLTRIFPDDSYQVEGNKEHGTKVLEVLRAKINENTIHGIVSDSEVFLSSTIFKKIANDNNANNIVVHSEENALLKTFYYTENGRKVKIENGSIIMFEVALPPYPIEVQPAVWQLIKVATSGLNAIVIEGAGNSEQDISKLTAIQGGDTPLITRLFQYYDDILIKLREEELNPTIFVPHFTNSKTVNLINHFINKDSGAIIIGAYIYENNIFKKEMKSNYDSRDNSSNKVKVFGIGSGIKTTLGDFGNTSAATAVIAGVAATLQSYVKALPRNTKYISSKNMLDLLTLSTTNNVIYQPNTRTLTILGKVPDVAMAISKINVSRYYNSLPNLQVNKD